MQTSKILSDVKYFFVKYTPIVYKAIISFFTVVFPNFFKQTFEFSSTKLSRIIGAAVAGILVLLVILDYKAFISREYKEKWLLLGFSLAFPLLIGLFAAFKISIKNKHIASMGCFLLILLLPIVSMTMTECLNGIFVYNMTHLGFVGNYIVILVFYFFFFALSGSLRITILATNVPLFGFALAHAYLMDFRGTPFIPMDFLSITTAVNVGNTYNYTPTDIIVVASLIFIFLTVLATKIKTPKFHIITKLVSRIFMGVFVVVLASVFYFTSVFADAGIKPDFWNQTRGYRNYGFVYNFMCNTKYLFVTVPSGYDPDAVGDYVASTIDPENNPITPSENAPNIICIMNESLADLSVLGEFETNEDYMPFLRSLNENTVKGNLYVPVIGAGTSNTEFEFLTGHTTAFLPSGSNAYMLYIKNPIASLTSTLEGQGYSSWAFHPYYADGWNRVNVYNNMGFNSFTALENIIDISLMEEYTNNGSNADYLQQLVDQTYPDRSNMLLRQYISDSYNYRLLIEDYENRNKDLPYYAFNVTMQNHGGYTAAASNFQEKIFLTSTQREYPKANRYLSLVKESDDAFKELVEYFSKVKEPTVICMFGDHHPSIESKFISEILDVNDLSNITIEQEQGRHITPFYIWANYDIEEQYIDRLSVNYLSSYVLKTAGVKLTEYNKYLISLSKMLPVIDTVGYIDADGNHYKWSNTSQYTSILQEYEKIQYNNIFDYENNNTDIFYLEGYGPEYIAADIAKKKETK